MNHSDFLNIFSLLFPGSNDETFSVSLTGCHVQEDRTTNKSHRRRATSTEENLPTVELHQRQRCSLDTDAWSRLRSPAVPVF